MTPWRGLFGRLRDAFNFKARLVSSYLEHCRDPPSCPMCGRALRILLERAEYSYTWDKDTCRFTVNPSCLKALACPRCNQLFESPVLRALINCDYSTERGSVRR